MYTACLFFLSVCAQVYGLTQVYFSPGDNVREKLIQHIDLERTAICAAVFLITEHAVCQALIQAKKRGVHVTLVLDHISFDDHAGRGRALARAGITVYHYNDGERSIMHNKFFIFSSLKKVWTGSYNVTKKASEYNQENVIITDDQAIIHAYEKTFESLITLCTPVHTRKKSAPEYAGAIFR